MFTERTPPMAMCLWLAIGLAATVPAGTIHADSFVYSVTRHGDSGPGTLRQAILDANARPGADTIVFRRNLVGSIVLASELRITDALTIKGPGPDRLTISGGGVTRVFHVDHTTVRIEGLTIAHGRALSGAPWQLTAGAGIFNNGENGRARLTVSRVVFTENDAIWGGALYNNAVNGRAWLTVSDSVFSGNSVIEEGGGIYNDGWIAGDARLTVANSTFSGNEAFVGGGLANGSELGGHARIAIINSILSSNAAWYAGGIYNNSRREGQATTVVAGSTIARNIAYEDGGGFYAEGDETGGSGELFISRSTLNENEAIEGGGGVNWFNEVTISNSTLSGNTASRVGGAVVNNRGALRLAHSTLVGNSAAALLYRLGSVALYHTLLANRSAGGNWSGDAGTFPTSEGYNLADDLSLELLGPGDVNDVDLLTFIGPLQDNGGPTLTHALLRGSVAIDAGDRWLAHPPCTDQRGLRRVARRQIDVGAFEFQPRERDDDDDDDDDGGNRRRGWPFFTERDDRDDDDDDRCGDDD